MASKGYTPAELKSLLKTQLESIAKQLGIDPAGMLKQEIADRILEVAALVGDTDTAPGADLKSETEGSVTSVRSALLHSPIHTPPIVTTSNILPAGSLVRGPTFDFSQQPSLFLELRKLEIAAEAEERQFQQQKLQARQRAEELLDRQKAEDRAWQMPQASEQAQRAREQRAADEDAARVQRQFDEESARLQADREQQQLQAQQRQQVLQDEQLRAQLFEQGLQREEQQRQRDHEMALAQLNGAAPRPAPRGDGTPFFKVESAIKLMPKLLDDMQIDIYLVTFEKLAELHSWPKLHWSA